MTDYIDLQVLAAAEAWAVAKAELEEVEALCARGEGWRPSVYERRVRAGTVELLARHRLLDASRALASGVPDTASGLPVAALSGSAVNDAADRPDEQASGRLERCR